MENLLINIIGDSKLFYFINRDFLSIKEVKIKSCIELFTINKI